MLQRLPGHGHREETEPQRVEEGSGGAAVRVDKEQAESLRAVWIVQEYSRPRQRYTFLIRNPETDGYTVITDEPGPRLIRSIV